MRIRANIFFIFCFLSVFTSCKYFQSKGKDTYIVKVGDKKLYNEEILALVGGGVSKEDSVLIVEGYVQNWIKETLISQEAEKNISINININKLVDDYRSSLLVYNYEKVLIDNQLDTVVSDEELNNYYELNSSLYRLSHPIIKVIAGSVDIKSNSKNQIRKLGQQEDNEEFKAILTKEGELAYGFEDSWIKLSDFQLQFSDEILNNRKLSKNTFIQNGNKGREYFVKILDYYDENEIPPFEYISGEITKSILSQRKNKLLTDYRNILFQKATTGGEVEYSKIN